MPTRLTAFAAILGAAIVLFASAPAGASAAPSPWWQVLPGSRPTNMWEPTDNVQEITTETVEVFGAPFVAARVEVGGETVGCLGTANFAGTFFCENETGFAPIETSAQLEATLEATFGTSAVEVSGGPVGGDPFVVTVPRRSAPSIDVSLVMSLGGAEAKILSNGGSGRLVLTITNLGDAPVDATSTPVTIVDELPAGIEATGVEAFAGAQGKAGPVECEVKAADEVSCSFEDELPSYEAIEVEILASLTGEPPVQGAPGKATVSGGNAASASATQEVKFSPQPTPFGIERFSQQSEEEGGAPTRQGGGHPFQLTTTVQLNSGPLSPGATREETLVEQPALPRNLRFPLPAGLVGNATAMPQCAMSVFLSTTGGSDEGVTNKCPDASAIGVASVTIVADGILGLVRVAVPVFNLPPAHGEPARFGFKAVGSPVLIDTALDPEDEYRIVASVSNVTQLAQYLSSTVSLWGTPGDPRHDSARGWNCTYKVKELGPCARPPGLSEAAFLRQPVSCNAPLDFGMQLEPWNVPIGSQVESASFSGDPLLGCNKVPFDPTISSAATSKLAESPSGLSFSLNMPNSGLLNGAGIAEGQPKKVEVTLPKGMTVNPSAAEGLAVCTPADYAREKFNSKPGQGCPDAAKIGNVQIDTPLIAEQVKGALYLAAPHDNPFDSLLGLYIVARVPERGVLVKLAGKVSPDPMTGQLVTTFDDAPQLPFESFELNFREGGRAPLVTPPACGDYDILAKFTPWSAQDPDNPAPNEVITRKSTFTVQRGVDGGACPPGGVPPFKPEFQAGSINNDAASHTPFNMRLIRHDGEQDMTKFSTVLPPGMLGKLAGVSKCPTSAIAVAKAKTASEEIVAPSCPANSEIGRSLAGAGVGSILTYIPGKVYLGGPLNGDPLSVIAITPAKAGPFDVGTVVVQEALTLNPKTAEVEVDGEASDPIPHILAGIPVKLRDLRVYVDRPDFIVNPTSCEESKTEAALFGSFLDVFNPADDKPVALSDRFQAANCANLGFKPKLALNLKGGTKRGGHPGLKALYKPRKGDANLEGLTVRLPRSAFLDQAHIRTICTRVQFAAKACPIAAQYGYIKAWTPLLEEPLEGPVYLRSSNHKLPDLVFDLHGLVDVEVATRIDSAKGGIRATVESSPDAPLTKVELRMQGAKKGLIINSRDLCAAPSRANVQFSGHNGKQSSARPVMRAEGCGD
ncbi:MAG: hypothetical protein ABW196_09790 [Solirubrobacterales bacterium]